IFGIPTSGGFLNDLLTPAVRFSPWATPLLGPIAPMVSSDSGRGLTGIPVTRTTLASAQFNTTHVCSNQSKLVFLIRDLLLFNISSREEKSHHSLEELVHELDGERHHIHLMMEKDVKRDIRYNNMCRC
uniref:Uncharacterized protein n=1 Tax=Stegastes partitus TaxID=144197 RepID=A0A3B5B9W3_9TELE